jgi:hypothetical protein
MVGGRRQSVVQHRRVNVTARLTEMNGAGCSRLSGEQGRSVDTDVDGLWRTCA